MALPARARRRRSAPWRSAMIHQLSGGAWGVVIRRLLGAASRTLPVLTLLFLPIVLGMHHLYEWTHADVVAPDPILQRQAALPERAVLPRARGALLRGLERARVLPEQVVARAGPRPATRASPRRMQVLSGGGLLALRPDDDVRVVRLGDVARAALVLDDLRHALHGRPGADRARVPDRHAGVAEPPRRRSTTIVAPAHFHDLGNLMLAFVDAVGLLLVLAVPDHLVGQPAGGDHLVPAPAAHRLALHRRWRSWSFHFARAVPGAAVARRQARAAAAASRSRSAILVVRLVDLFWLIAPAFHQRRLQSCSWLDVRRAGRRSARSGSAASSGSCAAAPLLPVHDPQFRRGARAASIGARPSTAH